METKNTRIDNNPKIKNIANTKPRNIRSSSKLVSSEQIEKKNNIDKKNIYSKNNIIQSNIIPTSSKNNKNKNLISSSENIQYSINMRYGDKKNEQEEYNKIKKNPDNEKKFNEIKNNDENEIKLKDSINNDQQYSSIYNFEENFYIEENQKVLKNNLNYPIIIDNDVEQFRIRLDNMLNKFKLESVSEILKTKKNLLIDQSKFLNNEKKSFNAEMERLKEEIEKQRKRIEELEKKEKKDQIKILRLSRKLGESKNLAKRIPIMSRIFCRWKNQQMFTKAKKQNIKTGDFFRKQKLIAKFYLKLKKIHFKNKIEKTLLKYDEDKSKDFNSIIFKLNNNNNRLEKRVEELERELKTSLKNKIDLQQKIQSAFIKGLNTINLETMSALDIRRNQEMIQNTSIDKKVNFLSIDEFCKDSGQFSGNVFDEKKIEKTFSNDVKFLELERKIGVKNDLGKERNKESGLNVFFEPHLQSKESLWKQAPSLNKDIRKKDKEKIIEFDI